MRTLLWFFRVGTMNIRLFAACAVTSLAVSACGRAGSSAVPAGRVAINPITPVASNPPGAGGGSAASAQRATMSISIVIPAKKPTSATKRAPKTVSSGTAYVDVVLQSFDGDPQPVSGPYSVLVPVSQLGSCSTGGRAHTRATESMSGCVSVSVPAPVGRDVYAVGALDSSMTLLDYVENVSVTVADVGTATLAATLDGVGSSVIGYTMLADPLHTTQYRLQHGVDCPANHLQYDAKAVCSFVFDVGDASGDDMAVGVAVGNQAYLANLLAFTVTDLTTQQPLSIGYDAFAPNAAAPVQEIDFDPIAQAGLSGATLNAGPLGTYNAAVHPDLSEIPANATDTIEFKAVLSPATTRAFGPNVLLPNTNPVAFEWDLSCKNVTVGADDPSGVAQGSVLQFCEPQESSLHVVIR
jgi:hypothetical protein